jgi:hypothetical protein
VGPGAATVLMKSPPGSKAVDDGESPQKASGWFAPVAARLVGKKPAPRRLLFLDDDPRRAEIFLAEHPQAVWVQTVVECVSCLQESWDEVHLDHDLGGKHFVGTDEVDCGMEVIRWMCKEPRDHLLPTLFFIHTHNLVAGLLMVMQMRTSGFKAEFRPFGDDLERILAHNEPTPAQDADPEVSPTTPLRRWLAWIRSWRKGRKPDADARNEPESIGRV